MTIALALAILVLTDCVLCGFRGAAGREGTIDKLPYYCAAMLRAARDGVVLVVFHALVVVAFVATATDPNAAWATFVGAGRVAVTIFGVYATAILVAFGFYFAPIGDFRVLTNVIVFGPFTLARPFVIFGGLVTAIVTAHDTSVTIVGVLAIGAMLTFQHRIDRRYDTRWQRLLDTPPTG